MATASDLEAQADLLRGRLNELFERDEETLLKSYLSIRGILEAAEDDLAGIRTGPTDVPEEREQERLPPEAVHRALTKLGGLEVLVDALDHRLSDDDPAAALMMGVIAPVPRLISVKDDMSGQLLEKTFRAISRESQAHKDPKYNIHAVGLLSQVSRAVDDAEVLRIFNMSGQSVLRWLTGIIEYRNPSNDPSLPPAFCVARTAEILSTVPKLVRLSLNNEELPDEAHQTATTVMDVFVKELYLFEALLLVIVQMLAQTTPELQVSLLKSAVSFFLVGGAARHVQAVHAVEAGRELNDDDGMSYVSGYKFMEFVQENALDLREDARAILHDLVVFLGHPNEVASGDWESLLQKPASDEDQTHSAMPNEKVDDRG